jgi:hypothetical protein
MSNRVKYNLYDQIKGVKLPDNTKKVWRSGTVYGNPFKVGKNEEKLKEGEFTREEALRLYEIYLDFVVSKKLLDIEPLRGYNLACHCKLEDNCHADILLKKLESK